MTPKRGGDSGNHRLSKKIYRRERVVEQYSFLNPDVVVDRRTEKSKCTARGINVESASKKGSYRENVQLGIGGSRSAASRKEVSSVPRGTETKRNTGKNGGGDCRLTAHESFHIPQPRVHEGQERVGYLQGDTPLVKQGCVKLDGERKCRKPEGMMENPKFKIWGTQETRE